MSRSEKNLLALISLLYVGLTVSISFQLPLFEGPDEFRHYDYIRRIADEGDLPDPYSQAESQYHQAPLYYLALAPLAALSPDPDYRAFNAPERFNPFYQTLAEVPAAQNKNVLLHRRAEKDFLNGGATVLNGRLFRLPSVLFGLLTVWGVYAITRLILPTRPAARLLVTACAAFYPLFMLMTAVISNDPPTYALSTWSLFLLLYGLRHAPTPRLALGLGVLLGAGIATKTSAGVLALPVALTLAVDRRWWRFAPLILGLTAVTGLWWNARNLFYYDDPFLTRAFGAMWPWMYVAEGRFDLATALRHFPRVYGGLWAQFQSLGLPRPAYQAFDAVVLACGAGGLWALWRGRTRLSAFDFKNAAILGAGLGAWALWVFYIYGSTIPVLYGRQLLGGLAGLACFFALGGLAYLPPRWEKRGAWALGLAVLGVAVLTWGYFRLAFLPVPLRGQPAQTLHVRVGEGVDWLGFSPAQVRGRAGQIVRLELDWQALAPAPSEHVVLYVNSMENDLIRRNTYPMGGNRLASEWEAGEKWRERVYLRIPADAPPQTLTLVVGWYDLQTGQTWPTRDLNTGAEVYPALIRLEIE